MAAKEFCVGRSISPREAINENKYPIVKLWRFSIAGYTCAAVHGLQLLQLTREVIYGMSQREVADPLPTLSVYGVVVLESLHNFAAPNLIQILEVAEVYPHSSGIFSALVEVPMNLLRALPASEFPQFWSPVHLPTAAGWISPLRLQKTSRMPTIETFQKHGLQHADELPT